MALSIKLSIKLFTDRITDVSVGIINTQQVDYKLRSRREFTTSDI